MIGLFPPDAIAVATDGDLCAVLVDAETTTYTAPIGSLLELIEPVNNFVVLSRYHRMASMTIRGRAATTGAADLERYSTATQVRTYDDGLIAIVWPAVQYEDVAFVRGDVFVTLQAVPGQLPAWMSVDVVGGDRDYVMGWVVLP